MKNNMQNIIDQLNEWKENIDCDIKSDWIDEEKKNECIRQSISLSMTIGILNGIGDNNNIPKS